MKKLYALLAVLLFALCFSVSAFGEDAMLIQATVSLNTEVAKPSYAYLKGTRYKNLIETKYENLVETTKVPEEITEETSEEGTATGSGFVGKRGVSGAADPGYTGAKGRYSLSNRTVAASLTVAGTSLVNRAIWQDNGSSTYYEPSNVAWAAKTAHLRSGEISQNTVIYGHNWKNCFAPFKKTGSQFESLMALTYQDVVNSNQYIYLDTNMGLYTYKIFAVSFTKDTSFYINCNNIDVASIASRAKSMSLFDFGVSVGSGDKIITLSTCTRYFSGLGARQRFIVMGKLVSVS